MTASQQCVIACFPLPFFISIGMISQRCFGQALEMLCLVQFFKLKANKIRQQTWNCYDGQRIKLSPFVLPPGEEEECSLCSALLGLGSCEADTVANLLLMKVQVADLQQIINCKCPGQMTEPDSLRTACCTICAVVSSNACGKCGLFIASAASLLRWTYFVGKATRPSGRNAPKSEKYRKNWFVATSNFTIGLKLKWALVSTVFGNCCVALL